MVVPVSSTTVKWLLAVSSDKGSHKTSGDSVSKGLYTTTLNYKVGEGAERRKGKNKNRERGNEMGTGWEEKLMYPRLKSKMHLDM